jgi:hypothetical protein
VVAPWYLSWSQGWLKLADKTLVVAFIPLLLVAFIVMPYFEVGKSRRYADRRVGLTVSMLFIAVMLISNWMGTPEFRVTSSPDREVSIEMLPEEGPSVLKAVPFEFLTPGTYLPAQEIEGNPHLTRALEAYYEAMHRHSCTLIGDPQWAECEVVTLESGEKQYDNYFSTNVMPDPYTELRIEEEQSGLRRMTLFYEVANPDNPDELTIDSNWVSYRHADSNYEEECRYANKSC